VKSYAGRELPEIERLPDHISFGRHALAIHERRHEMTPTLWTDWDGTSSDRVIQTWFPGAHADVGGGYSESELSHIAFGWMAQQCRGPSDGSWGLTVTESPPTMHQTTMHQTRTGDEDFYWGFVDPVRKRIEHPRKELTECLRGTPAANRILSSMYVHQSTCDDLLHPLDITLHDSWPEKAKEDAREEVGKVRDLALQVYLELQHRYGRAAIR
jgi:hypothetical protein